MTDRQTTPPMLDASIRIDHLPPEGRGLKLVTTVEQRTAIAERLQVSAVESLDADLQAVKFRGGIRVFGRLRAVVVQPCVVTFVPVTQAIDEPVERIFLPTTAAAKGRDEVFVDVDEEDEPDYFDGPEADLSELIIESLALAIDPYPRAPGASVGALDVKLDKDEPESPFARLKALRDDGDKEP
ncbi:MAG TPA: DUF177 domain-containing protein [Devosiaceae bacterium]|jgi:uncharacterized metal-binding protein YceD (DUF177 family)